mmetsp:Transcript_24562/g.77013  ORF Transcript_24562/g.77013 Transcript_24562/m.77013 type:complete len:314 (-) Transcript_24562:227-1168(-)
MCSRGHPPLPRDAASLVIHEAERDARTGGLDGPQHPRDGLVGVDQALPGRHVRADVPWVEQHHRRLLFTAQVHVEALSNDIARRLARAVRVRSAAPVVVNRAHLRREDGDDRQLPAWCSQNLRELLCHKEWAHGVDAEHVHHRLLRGRGSRRSAEPLLAIKRAWWAVDASIVDDVRQLGRLLGQFVRCGCDRSLVADVHGQGRELARMTRAKRCQLRRRRRTTVRGDHVAPLTQQLLHELQADATGPTHDHHRARFAERRHDGLVLHLGRARDDRVAWRRRRSPRNRHALGRSHHGNVRAEATHPPAEPTAQA